MVRRRSHPRPQSSPPPTAPLALDERDLEALLAVLQAETVVDADREIARLQALLGPSASRLEAHVSALRDKVVELERARHLALTDPLTGLANRRAFTDTLRRELARAARGGTQLSIVLFDLDAFKAVNDTFGHAVGDRVLRHFARCANDRTRQGDLLARIGGDEFVLLLPDTDDARARAIGERIRRDVGRGGKSNHHAIAVSLGVADVSCARASAHAALADADRDLYRDKAARKAAAACSLPR